MPLGASGRAFLCGLGFRVSSLGFRGFKGKPGRDSGSGLGEASLE